MTANNAALIIVGHGSARNPESSRPTRDHAVTIRRRRIFAEVHTAFCKESPRLEEILDRVKAKTVYVVPNFACRGYITSQVIPHAMGLTGAVTERGDQTVHLCDPVGIHPAIPGIISETVAAVTRDNDLESSQTALLLIGHGSARTQHSSIQTRQVAGELASRDLAAETAVAFLEHPPRVADWATDTTARSVIAVPYMISNGLHGAEDIPRILGIDIPPQQARRLAHDGTAAGPFTINGRCLWYCRAIGSNPKIADIIVAQALS